MHVSPEGSGAVRVSVNGVLKGAPYQFTILDNVVVEATEAAGYRFVEWSGSMSGSENPEDIVISGDRDITAHFLATEVFTAFTGDDVEAGMIAGTSLVISAVDPSTIADTEGRPEDMPYGLFGIAADAEGGRAVIRLYLPEPAPDEYRWFKYSETGGWIDFSRGKISGGTGDGAEFNSDRTEVTIHITDNGPYDANPADGVIEDPSGLGSSTDGGEPTPSSDDDGGGGCFITTVAE